MTLYECPTCDRAFGTEQGLRIHHGKAHDRALPNRECAHCETEFYSEYECKYCSEECRSEAVSFAGTENPNYSGEKATTSCTICGDSFEYYPSEKEGLYCPSCVESEQWQSPPALTGSDNPRWNGGKRTVTCDTCGATIERWSTGTDGRVFCDTDCQSEWLSDHFVGSDHPNWQDTDDIAYGPGWNEARERALERDGYCCQVCGATRAELGQNPDVHHIRPVRWFVNSESHTRADAHSLANLIALCRSCHRSVESGDITEAALRSLIGEDG